MKEQIADTGAWVVHTNLVLPSREQHRLKEQAVAEAVHLRGRPLSDGGLRFTTHRNGELLDYTTFALQREIETLTGASFDKAMWNFYEGSLMVRPHHDAGNADVAIASFGAPGRFKLERCDGTKDDVEFLLEDGDVLFLPDDTQTNYGHSVRSVDERASLVLRRTKKGSERLCPRNHGR
jgi:hypothetical protein